MAGTGVTVPSKGLRAYAALTVAYGLYNLLGVGNYSQFAMMFKPLSSVIIALLYAFTVFYGICCVYCGSRIFRLEDWARKMIVACTALSVISGFFLNRTVMANMKDFIARPESNVPAGMEASVYNWMVIFMAVVTLYELSVVWFFTRPGVISQFSHDPGNADKV